MVPIYFKGGKTGSQAISSFTNTAAASQRELKVDPCYLQTLRTKNVVHSVSNKEIYYDIYLESEKLVHSNQQHEKSVSQLFGSGKNWFLTISSLTNTVAAIMRKKEVDPCYLETKKSSS